MVLESIMNPKKAERKPWEMFFVGLLYSSIAIVLSLWIFKEQSSLVMVFLTVIACVPLMYHTIKLEEKKDTQIAKERILLKEHSKALSFFIFLFLGFLLSFTIWYIFLPGEIVETIFHTQISTIEVINSQFTGEAIHSSSVVASSVDTSTLFTRIFSNNIKVLFFCIFFSFFYGAGAIFILTWNASVIGAAMGTFIRNNLSVIVNKIGWVKAATYLHVFSLGLLRYSIHGIPEILAYFTGGLAGGIISVAVIRHDLGTEKFKHILIDSIDLIVLAVVILFLAALLEVFVTPLLF